MPNRSREINQEQIAKESRLKQPAPETKDKPQKPHAIETYYVGLPGQEKLVANTAYGEQVGIRSFDRSSVLDTERAAIEQAEENTLSAMKGKDITEVGDLAKRTIEASGLEAKDVGKLVELLEQKQNIILFVDTETINDPSIPREGLHLLIPKGEAEKLQPHLQNFGYDVNQIGDIGIKAEKGNSKLVFIYSQERSKQKAV
ncbi:hypothetical protein GYA54_04580 [Candidatus Kuenenbacteria bacterium]|nr:hypothetical protein [Candidatus Kuenenbacteria bacterium]